MIHELVFTPGAIPEVHFGVLMEKREQQACGSTKKLESVAKRNRHHFFYFESVGCFEGTLEPVCRPISSLVVAPVYKIVYSRWRRHGEPGDNHEQR